MLLAEMNVIRAEIRDAISIARLHIEAEQETYENTIPSLLDNVSEIHGRSHIWNLALGDNGFGVFCLLAKEPSGSLMGFLSGRIVANEGSAHLNSIYLLKRHQRKGFGRRLFASFAEEACSREVQDIVAVVPADNIEARHFLAWCGGLEASSEAFTYRNSSVRMVSYKWGNLQQLVSYFHMLR